MGHERLQTSANGQDKSNYSNKTDQELLTKNENNSELITQKPIDGTPFTALQLDGKWYLTMGKYRLTKEGELNSEEECIEESKNASWWRIMQVTNIMIAEDKTEQKLNRGLY